MGRIPTHMEGAVLPGNSTVELRTFDVPAPGTAARPHATAR